MAFTQHQTKRQITRFSINTANITQFYQNVQNTPLGENWPVVYLLHNDNYVPTPGSRKKLMYIGETTSAVRRMMEHFARTNPNYKDRKNLNLAHIIFDHTFNKSAILDIEQELIHMFSADGSNYELQNRNDGQSKQHQYFNREDYIASLRDIWDELRAAPIGIAKDTFEEVRNSNLFKYSPYTALTPQQEKACQQIVDSLIDAICNGTDINAVISGVAGTGKTVVLIKALSELMNIANSPLPTIAASGLTMPSGSRSTSRPSEDDDWEEAEHIEVSNKTLSRISRLKAAKPNGLKVAYVVPLSELLPPFRAVIKAVCGNASIVKSATEVANTPGQYDVIFVDEAHRLGTINKFGANKTPYKQACNNALGVVVYPGMPNPPTELDWISHKSKCCVYVYDKGQKVRSHASITHQDFSNVVLNKSYTNVYTLTAQMRCKAGDKYVRFLEDFFNNSISSSTPLPPWKGYDFRVYDDVDQMISAINAYNSPGNCGLSRVVAGYGWKWVTMGKRRAAIQALPHSAWDIHIGGHDYFWNEQSGNFIFKAEPEEIGCVHTVQGFDLNYVGIIFGPEIKYDPVTGFSIDKDNIFDSGVKTKNKVELLELTIRAYKIMMERGIRGCYVYACDPGLQAYLKQYIPSPAVAIQNLELKINGGTNKLTGLDISTNGTGINGSKVQLNKADVDAILSGNGGISTIETLTINNKIYEVADIRISEDDDEYYIVSIQQPKMS